jgi:F-type H+-transporting ATPase subunit b
VEMSWSTFILEIFNFLILVWILKHFLYKPVLNVIERRQSGIRQTLANAEAMSAEAQELQKRNEGQLAEWDLERQQAREALASELEAERARKMEELRADIEQERLKARVTGERQQADTMRRIEEAALGQGARFAARLLEQAAGPELQARLVDMAIDGLSRLPPERTAALRNSYGRTADAIVVEFAYPLPDDQHRRLKQTLAEAIHSDRPWRFERNDDLLAGIRITIDAWVLAANLQDELKGFAELAHGE